MGFELPHQSGAYRWWYADVTAGDLSAVFIFMVGSIFSARYSASLKRGGLPQQHAAVNFALYQGGQRRAWVLTEYRDVSVGEGGRRLRIGDSWLRRADDGSVTMHVVDRTALWGQRTEATLSLTPTGPSHDEITLVDGLSHRWQPIAARASARLEVPSHRVAVEGAGYHDGNRGDVALGSDLAGWEWHRVHEAHRTTVLYRPWSAGSAISVEVGERATMRRVQVPTPDVTRSIWGLPIPNAIGVDAEPTVLESSPFYARSEAHDEHRHSLGEVADFDRFHRPWVRWMASMRTRTGAHP